MSAEHLILERLESIEGLLRRLLPGSAEPVPAGGGSLGVGHDISSGPFALSDAELRQAERLLSPDEGRVLRMRVMAARLDARGQRDAARRQRGKADRLERQLQQDRRAA